MVLYFSLSPPPPSHLPFNVLTNCIKTKKNKPSRVYDSIFYTYSRSLLQTKNTCCFQWKVSACRIDFQKQICWNWKISRESTKEYIRKISNVFSHQFICKEQRKPEKICIRYLIPMVIMKRIYNSCKNPFEMGMG